MMKFHETPAPEAEPPPWLSEMTFEVIDIRASTDTFLPEITSKAKSLPAGKGLLVVQAFEPVRLYYVMAGMGWRHYTRKVDDTEYHVFFFREVSDHETKITN